MTQKIVFRKGHKVVLRPITEADVPLLVKWLNDGEVTRFMNRFYPMTEKEEREWVQNMHNDLHNNILLMIETHDGTAIGNMGLHRINWVHRFATTGTMIGEREYQGKGYGTDAKMLLLDYAFNCLNLRKIYSYVHAFNGRSIRYAEKCGYTKEASLKDEIYVDGAYHDTVILSVFREAWLPLWESYKKGLA